MLSKLSEKCKKCSHVDDCDEKRMEACAVLDVIDKIDIKPNISISLTMPITAPILRDTSIEAEINEHIRKQIAEELYKDLYKHLNCSFNKLNKRG